jgi:hypothetical protein
MQDVLPVTNEHLFVLVHEHANVKGLDRSVGQQPDLRHEQTKEIIGSTIPAPVGIRYQPASDIGYIEGHLGHRELHT